MGGSGRGYFDGDVANTIAQLREAQQASQNAEYLAKCNKFLGSLLVRFNDRNVDAVNRHLTEIKGALEKEVAGTIDVLFGGSVAKHTYVDGLSDIDSLVMLDSCELADSNPVEAKDYLARRLRERFASTEVTEGRLAVTLHFGDADIQLLPAVSCRSAVKIPDEQGTRWREVQPQEFARALTEANDRSGKKVVPVVKLAKAAIANLPEQQQISGYHAEALAVAIFHDYGGPTTNKDMLRHYFTEASRRVLRPIPDVTGQSLHVDEYLGVEASLERRVVSDAFGRIARRMERGDMSGRVEDWAAVFGEPV